MNSSRVDSLLRVAPPAAKTVLVDAPRDGGEFEKHLRQAAQSQSALATSTSEPKVSAKEPIVENTTVAGDQEHNASSDPNQVPLAETKSTEEAVATAEEELVTVEPDEVLLSVAATSFQEAAPIIVMPAVGAEEIVVTAEVSLPVFESGESGSPEQNSSSGVQSIELATEPVAERASQPIEEADLLIGETVKPVIPTDAKGVEPEVAQEVAIEQIVEQPTLRQTAVPPVEVTDAEAAEGFEQQPTTEEPKVQSPHTPALRVANTPVAAPTEKPPFKPQKVADQTTKGEEAVQAEIPEKAKPRTSAVSAELVLEKLDAKKLETSTRREIESPSPAPILQPTAHSSHVVEPKVEALVPQAETGAVHERESDALMPTIDRARFVQRVVNAFRSAQQNDGHIQLRLSPPELGSLKIEIAVRHGVLTANLEAETADARRVLLDNLPALRGRLAEQDIRIEKFEVDVRREGGQQGDQTGAHDRQAQQSQRVAEQNRIRTPQQMEVLTARIPRSVSTATNSNLDVRI